MKIDDSDGLPGDGLAIAEAMALLAAIRKSGQGCRCGDMTGRTTSLPTAFFSNHDASPPIHSIFLYQKVISEYRARQAIVQAAGSGSGEWTSGI
ncbi:MAG: hypothetical protein LBE86_08015 [Gemmobacter sp.]|jgi:hypothetical protein|nr:hypothetical protein [Gemmobacter sp.]